MVVKEKLDSYIRVDERSWKDEAGENVCGGFETNVFEIKCQRICPQKNMYTRIARMEKNAETTKFTTTI